MIHLSPILFFLGLCLITSKAPNLYYYAKEIVILSLLAIAPIIEQFVPQQTKKRYTANPPLVIRATKFN